MIKELVEGKVCLDFLVQRAGVHPGGEAWTEVAGTCLLMSQPEVQGRKRKLEVGVAFNLKIPPPVPEPPQTVSGARDEVF